MANEKNQKSDFPKSFISFYNSGKYGNIGENHLNQKLVNKRVVSEEKFATIRYVGTLPNSTGVWLGVDWDDASRGRHDGRHNGVKYFDTLQPTSGSFIRPCKVSLGLTVEEAIKIRYGSSFEQDDSNVMLDEFFLESSDSDGECGTSNIAFRSMRTSHQKIKVNISGPANGAFNVSSGQLHRLKSAVLHALPVFRCNTDEEGGGKLNELMPSLNDLDLAQTLINDWVEVAKVTSQLPNLTTLNVSDNRFISLFPLLESASELDYRKQLYVNGFRNIVYLILVRVYYSWKEFYNVFEFFPKLEHICMAYNKLTVLEPTIHQNFSNLSYMDLACNEISDFEISILPFGKLKNLQTLLLNENRIEKITLPGSLYDESDLFCKLKLLAISNNKISSWEAIHHLARLQSLREIIFIANPILDQQKSQETARQDVIAKMAKLKILNRNDIKYEERKGAEIDYLKRYGKGWLLTQPVEGDDDDSKATKMQLLDHFLIDHPRFLKLIDLYGAPEQSEMKEVTRKLKERLIEVVFECPLESGDNSSVRSIKRKIPNHMTVQHLRNLLRRLYRLSAKSEFNLCYVSNFRPDLEIPLEADTREIGFYNLQEGDRVILHLNNSS